ncbi:MAG: hypothetical protein KJ613_01735, partial [Nanoarchaeota archaeon]|nr:hypothetical protein [Nanoarchaeota archaeon]
MTRILIVDDNPKFREGAEKYFDSREDIKPYIDFDYCSDYIEAESIIKLFLSDIRGAIIDCFFPYESGSANTYLGKETVEKMASSDPREMKIAEGLEFLEEYVDLEDPDMMNYARFLVNESSRSYDDISQNPIFLAIKQVSIL